MRKILLVPATHPLNKVDAVLRQKLRRAQDNIFEKNFGSAAELVERVFDDLKAKLKAPRAAKRVPATDFADRPFTELSAFYTEVARQAKMPLAAVPLFAQNAAERTQLVSAFDNPDAVVRYVGEKVTASVEKFPKTADDIECGSNPGDVIDPYILAATQQLMYAGNFESAVGATVAHKALMMIEDLIGHLHEDVIGSMRGNVRVPEARGNDQERLDPAANPFPGADVVQPPLVKLDSVKFHQIKSKTGSATGGGGRRIGRQLKALVNFYGGTPYFDALIGNTLRGHRSRAGIADECPETVFLVGGAAFRELTRRATGPELMLRVYQAAFRTASAHTGYDASQMAAGIVATFRERAEAEGEGLLDVILRDVIGANPAEQDSRTYQRPARGSNRRRP